MAELLKQVKIEAGSLYQLTRNAGKNLQKRVKLSGMRGGLPPLRSG
jgi:hypothetical protein